MHTSDDSPKRARNIQTRRVSARLHTRLSRFCAARRYDSLFNGLEYLAEVGLDYLEEWGDVPPKDAKARTEKHR